MKLSTKGRYALEAILYMAAQDTEDYLNINQIVEATKIPVRYLEQILFVLRKAGLIKTLRGAKGGYGIVDSIEQLTVGIIIRAVEGEIVLVPCVKDIDKCSSEAMHNCVTRDLWVKLTETVESVIDTVSIKSLVEAYKTQTLSN